MNDPKSAPANPPSEKSPFAHRSTRAQFPAGPVPAAPNPPAATPRPAARRRGAPAGLVAGGIAAVAVVIAAGVYLSGGDKSGKTPSPAVSAGAPAPTPAARLAAAEARFAAAVSLARKYDCHGTAPDAFAKVLVAESDARAAKAAGRTDAASAECEAGASAAERLAAPAAKAAYAAALAAAGLPDLRDYAGDACRVMESDAAKGEAALARNDFESAASAFDRAAAGVPVAVSAVKLRLESLARDAVAGGAAAEAGIFYRKLAALDPGHTGAADWLMRKGVAAGATMRSAKLGFPLAYAVPGGFTEGSSDAEPGRDADEIRRPVTITKGFWMGVTEVTQGQWDAVMGRGAAAAKLAREKRGFVGEDLPMVDVTWREAEEFCRRLSAVEGARFRLPTEAEWEYACRAGVDAPYSTGKSFLSPGEAVVDDSTENAPDAPRAVTAAGAPVNAWGLRHMHGNVWEWCSDWYAARKRDAVTDPSGPDDKSFGRADQATKVVRGGSWNDPAKAARSAKRWQYPPAVAVNYIGFRVLMEFSPGAPPE